MLNASQTLSRKLEVKSLMSLLAAFAEGFKMAAEVMEATHATLDESERYREAIKQQSRPLDYESFTRFIDEREVQFLDHVREALKKAKVLKFELGRLWIDPESRSDETAIGFQRDAIRGILKEKFGVDFNLRYKHKEE